MLEKNIQEKRRDEDERTLKRVISRLNDIMSQLYTVIDEVSLVVGYLELLKQPGLFEDEKERGKYDIKKTKRESEI